MQNIFLLICHGLRVRRSEYGVPYAEPGVVNTYFVEGSLQDANEEAERLARAVGSGVRVDVHQVDVDADLSEIPYGSCSN